MNKYVRIGGAVVGGGAVVLAVGAGGGWMWATSARDAYMSKRWEVPYKAEFPIPFPLDDAELAALRAERATTLAAVAPPADPAAAPSEDPAAATPAPDPLAGVDLDAIAKERAIARGKHLVESRLGCMECHGADFAGGTMIDAPPMGKLLGPNITSGGVTKGWTAVDWDRIVRHGIMSDGHTAIMPADDFNQLSDRELADVASYIWSFPPSDAVVPAPQFGPVLTVLVATGQVPAAPYLIDHTKVPPKFPPPAAGDAVYGKHLTQSCQGCHGANLSGGPIRGGDPAWPPAANLTPTGMSGWTYEDFDAAVRKGHKKDGTEVRKPMPWEAYAKMEDLELQAIWAYVQTVPAAETGVR